MIYVCFSFSCVTAKSPNYTNLSSEERGDLVNVERLIFDSSDNFAISLEYCPKDLAVRQVWLRPMRQAPAMSYGKRYLEVPGNFKVRLLKKFLRAKFGLAPKETIDVLYMQEVLLDDHTMVDVAYIYAWRVNEPLKLFYKFGNLEQKLPPEDLNDVLKTKTDQIVIRGEDEGPEPQPEDGSSRVASLPDGECGAEQMKLTSDQIKREESAESGELPKAAGAEAKAISASTKIKTKVEPKTPTTKAFGKAAAAPTDADSMDVASDECKIERPKSEKESRKSLPATAASAVPGRGPRPSPGSGAPPAKRSCPSRAEKKDKLNRKQQQMAVDAIESSLQVNAHNAQLHTLAHVAAQAQPVAVPSAAAKSPAFSGQPIPAGSNQAVGKPAVAGCRPGPNGSPVPTMTVSADGCVSPVTSVAVCVSPRTALTSVPQSVVSLPPAGSPATTPAAAASLMKKAASTVTTSCTATKPSVLAPVVSSSSVAESALTVPMSSCHVVAGQMSSPQVTVPGVASAAPLSIVLSNNGIATDKMTMCRIGE